MIISLPLLIPAKFTPKNPDVFSNDVFLPSLATDRRSPPQQPDNDKPSNLQSLSGLCATSMSTAAPNELENKTLLTRISPYAKVDAKQKRQNKNKRRFSIITDISEKEKKYLSL